MPHFHLQGQIRYFEVDQQLRATPVRMVEYLQEAAIAHSEAVGLGLEHLRSQGVGWVLRRWSLQMQRYPILGEWFVVETWPCQFEHFNATREFRILSSTGEALGQASSHWIFLSLLRKRPARIPGEFAEAYGLSPERAMDRPLPELSPVDKPATSLAFTVRRSDIDTNNHVNNAKYLEWILETIPQDIYDQGTMSALDIVYQKETAYGASVQAHSEVLGRDSQTHTFRHTIVDPTDGRQLALAQTAWQRTDA